MEKLQQQTTAKETELLAEQKKLEKDDEAQQSQNKNGQITTTQSTGEDLSKLRTMMKASLDLNSIGWEGEKQYFQILKKIFFCRDLQGSGDEDMLNVDDADDKKNDNENDGDGERKLQQQLSISNDRFYACVSNIVFEDSPCTMLFPLLHEYLQSGNCTNITAALDVLVTLVSTSDVCRNTLLGLGSRGKCNKDDMYDDDYNDDYDYDEEEPVLSDVYWDMDGEHDSDEGDSPVKYGKRTGDQIYDESSSSVLSVGPHPLFQSALRIKTATQHSKPGHNHPPRPQASSVFTNLSLSSAALLPMTMKTDDCEGDGIDAGGKDKRKRKSDAFMRTAVFTPNASDRAQKNVAPMLQFLLSDFAGKELLRGPDRHQHATAENFVTVLHSLALVCQPKALVRFAALFTSGSVKFLLDKRQSAHVKTLALDLLHCLIRDKHLFGLAITSQQPVLDRVVRFLSSHQRGTSVLLKLRLRLKAIRLISEVVVCHKNGVDVLCRDMKGGKLLSGLVLLLGEQLGLGRKTKKNVQQPGTMGRRAAQQQRQQYHVAADADDLKRLSKQVIRETFTLLCFLAKRVKMAHVLIASVTNVFTRAMTVLQNKTLDEELWPLADSVPQLLHDIYQSD
eukprot:TRINITY_DN1005_c0_g2_i1.p1 TRINITY_DN1005_c0_g2~~TRINITY_DN1005_c0_g2_i1.p1  ORF type:complete len:697 (+),score=153.64 TRINITY_DN1005_c0_g2_i1:234-2093(+)